MEKNLFQPEFSGKKPNVIKARREEPWEKTAVGNVRSREFLDRIENTSQQKEAVNVSVRKEGTIFPQKRHVLEKNTHQKS